MNEEECFTLGYCLHMKREYDRNYRMQPARSAGRGDAERERDGNVLEDMRCVDAMCVCSRKPACGVSFYTASCFRFRASLAGGRRVG